MLPVAGRFWISAIATSVLFVLALSRRHSLQRGPPKATSNSIEMGTGSRINQKRIHIKLASNHNFAAELPFRLHIKLQDEGAGRNGPRCPSRRAI
jgi:hypothetical protein